MNKNEANLWLWGVWGDKKNTYTGYYQQVEKWSDEELEQYITTTPQMISFVSAFNFSTQFDLRKITEDPLIWQKFRVWQSDDWNRMERLEIDMYPNELYEYMEIIRQQEHLVSFVTIYIKQQLFAAEDAFVIRNSKGVKLGNFVNQELRDMRLYLSNL